MNTTIVNLLEKKSKNFPKVPKRLQRELIFEKISDKIPRTVVCEFSNRKKKGVRAKMPRSKSKGRSFGVFFTDASFDASSNFSVCSIQDATSGKRWTVEVSTCKNVKCAEKKGIIEAIKRAKGVYEHVLIFNDSMFAVFEIKKEIFSEKKFMKNGFHSVQIVWVPRELNEVADFFSKNIEKTRSEGISQKKFEMELEKTFETANIVDMIIDESEKAEILRRKILEDCRQKGVSPSSPFLLGEKKDLTSEELPYLEEDVKKLYPDCQKEFNMLIHIAASKGFE